MADAAYKNGILSLLSFSGQWGPGYTFRILLEDSASTYAANPVAINTHQYLSDLSNTTAGRLDGTGNGFLEMALAGFYARQTLTTLAVIISGGLVQLKLDDLTWTAINDGTIKSAVVYMQGPASADDTTPADDIIIARFTSGGIAGAVTNGSDFLITWNAAGMLAV